MEFNEYQNLAMRTITDYCRENKKEALCHSVFGLSSESGEVSGILQKEYQGHSIDKKHVIKELGDCLWMIAEACFALDISLDDVAVANINKLKARYPNGFEPERSLNRDKDDI